MRNNEKYCVIYKYLSIHGDWWGYDATMCPHIQQYAQLIQHDLYNGILFCIFTMTRHDVQSVPNYSETSKYKEKSEIASNSYQLWILEIQEFQEYLKLWFFENSQLVRNTCCFTFFFVFWCFTPFLDRLDMTWWVMKAKNCSAVTQAK